MTRLVATAIASLSVTGCSTFRSPPAQPIVAARAAPPDAAAPDAPDTQALESTLRTLLLANLPDPLVQSSRGWGQAKEGTVGVTFHRDGPRLQSSPVKGMRNDGAWRRVSVQAVNPAQTLAVGLSDVKTPEPGRTTFTARVGVDCNLKFEQQLWRNGVRLYSGETRGRCRAAAALRCEVVSRSETRPGQFLPDLVFRMRVTDAQLFYDGLVIEHTAGVGGDAARILGDALIDTVKRVKPDLERELLDKANAAVVKAADTKEVRVSFDALLKGGGGLVKRKP